MAEPIVLSNITFQAMNKWTYQTRQHLTFLSTVDGVTKELAAYKSMSELGFWRLFVLSEEGTKYYKGKDNGMDYVQQTFIHIELQKYFNRVFSALPDANGNIEARKFFSGDYVQSIRNHIDDETRMEHIEPFYSYFKDKSNRCGELPKATRNEDLLRFSSEVQDAFPTPEVPELVYENFNFVNTYVIPGGWYSFNKEEKISMTGDIYKIKLGAVEEKEIILYFVLYSLQTSFKERKPNKPENIFSPLNIKYTFAPIFLTTSTDITSYGLATKYVLAGNYICKILDYDQQCLPQNKKCTQMYRYVGYIFENVYPYTLPMIQALADTKKFHQHNNWLSKAGLKRVTKAGGRKRVKGGKRKTRKASKARV